MMKRKFGILASSLFLVLRQEAVEGAQTADPDAPTPAGLKSTILDLQFRTLDLLFRTEPVAGTVRALAVKETPTEIRIELAADVLFDFDKADIRPDAAKALAHAADLIRRHGRRMVLIEGHTDPKGGDAYNQRLSERRAESVRRWLQEREGVSRVPVQTRGWGAKKPVAPNTKPDGSDDPEGRQKNRRTLVVSCTPLAHQ